jgi:dihydrofolate reductase
VFSRSREGQRDAHAVFVAGDAGQFITRLKQLPGKVIWLAGGADLVRSFVARDLIDEYVISIHPVILGAGIPLFQAPLPPQRLLFRDCTTFNTGLLQVSYSRQR